MGSASSFSKSNANANASSVPNSYANSGIYDSNQGPEWQWRTDDLQWRSYSRACSAAIEAARVSGRSSVEINVGEGSNPTHFVFFQNQGLRQVNHRTHRGRPVRRYISGQSSTATWEWLETKRGQWHEYSDRLTSKFEAAWMGCTTSRTHNKKDCPAGLFFRLNGQAYSILFEADGIQCNLKTSSCRSIRRCTYLLNQMSSSYDQNLNLDTNSANYNSSLEAEWQWRTNDLHWRSYSHACSASIEAAFADGRPSVEINVFQDSSPTHLVYFENQTLVQVNRRTHRVRPVRRNIIGQSLAAIWEWWEAERSQWYEYGDHLSSKFEAAWIDCTASRTSGKQDCLAGVFFELNGRKYSILFEAVGMQYNVRTSSSRSVRRCTYLSSQTSTPQPEDMSHCQASNVTVQGQVTRNESEELNGSDYKYSDFICCANTDDEECSICLCSFQEDKAVELSKCHHLFHRQCIEQWFKTRPTCPQCLTVYDVITGNQPPGDMSIRCISSRSKEAENGIQGYPGIDIIEITYRFSSGIQTAEHPKPGRPYAGAVYVAYLPKNKDGEEVLELLEIAWIRRLLFTVGAAGMIDMVVWASIQNKTQKNGGASNNGYPDETYFNRVRSELARVNIM